jgi:hypothetical protein
LGLGGDWTEQDRPCNREEDHCGNHGVGLILACLLSSTVCLPSKRNASCDHGGSRPYLSPFFLCGPSWGLVSADMENSPMTPGFAVKFAAGWGYCGLNCVVMILRESFPTCRSIWKVKMLSWCRVHVSRAYLIQCKSSFPATAEPRVRGKIPG